MNIAPKSNPYDFNQKIITCLIFLLIARIISIVFIPINDTTEARYAEIAREMLETNQWIIPKLYYTIPFLAKPPFSFWMSALSMKCFGVHAFAARLPSLLFSFATLYLVWKIACFKHAKNALSAVLILAANIFFFLNAGAVMTEPALMFAMTLAMFSFWQALFAQKRIYSDLFFIAIAIGILTKGLVIFMIAGLPLFFWVLVCRKWHDLWQKLHWMRGIIIVLLTALPWYLWAEHSNPGFLHYFFISEHFERFLVPGWSGDKYGYVHQTPIGIIWFYALIGIAPWQGLMIYHYRKNNLRHYFFQKEKREWHLYLVCFAIIPLLFFTFSRNVIYPYAFSSSVPLSLLLWDIITKRPLSSKQENLFVLTASASASIFLCVTLLFVFMSDKVSKTQQPIVKLWKSHAKKDTHLVYWSEAKPDFSAVFYSEGHAINIGDTNTLMEHTKMHPGDIIIVNLKEKTLPESLAKHYQAIATLALRKKQYAIYQSTL